MRLSYMILDIISNSPFYGIMRKLPFSKTEKQPWAGDMVIESCGGGDRVKYPGYMSASEKIRWVSRKKTPDGSPVEIREPKERTAVYPADKGFTAAGKHYSNIGQLFIKMDESGTWCRDKYGREVLYLVERFPCFDSFDAMDESRYYRWFFLREGERLTRVFLSDAGWDIYVTEDVENLECGCWEEMQELNYFGQS